MITYMDDSLIQQIVVAFPEYVNFNIQKQLGGEASFFQFVKLGKLAL